MRFLLFCLSCVVPLSACSVSHPFDHFGGDASRPIEVRLRAVHLEPESGGWMFAGWYDRELEIECSFRMNVDGRWRCEPPATELPAGRARYLDSGCAEPVFEATRECPPKYVLSKDPARPLCPSEPLSLYRLGDPVEATALHRRDEDGVCRPVELTGSVLHRMEPVDPAGLVAAEWREGSGGRLALDYLVVEGGATQPIGLRDTLRGETCSLYGRNPRGMPETPCVPGVVSTEMIQGGVECDERWASALGECAVAPDFTVHQMIDECQANNEIWVLRATGRVPDDQRVVGDRCPWAELDVAYALERADDAVPWLTREVRGAGRMKRMVWTDGELETGTVLYDSRHETVCTGQRTAAGEFRCLPAFAHDSSGRPDGTLRHFVDDECTVQGFAAWAGFCGHPWSVARDETCDRKVEAIHRIVGPGGPGYRIDDDGACVPLEGHGLVYRLEPVPLTEFVRLEHRLD